MEIKLCHKSLLHCKSLHAYLKLSNVTACDLCFFFVSFIYDNPVYEEIQADLNTPLCPLLIQVQQADPANFSFPSECAKPPPSRAAVLHGDSEREEGLPDPGVRGISGVQ